MKMSLLIALVSLVLRERVDGSMSKPLKTETAMCREVLFERNSDHWEGVPANSVKFMRLVRHADAQEVKYALLNNTLDVVIGDGVLHPADVEEFRTQQSLKLMRT